MSSVSNLETPEPPPQPGWLFVCQRLGPLESVLRDRMERARLGVGAAAPALSVEQYAAWLQQQTTMLEELLPKMEASVAAINAEAATFVQGQPTAALEGACATLARQLDAIATWSECVWQTTPPVGNARSFAAVREIPGEILAQFGRYFEVVRLAAENRLPGDVRVSIDLQPLIERCVQQGQAERGASDPQLAGRTGRVAWITLGIGLFVIFVIAECTR